MSIRVRSVWGALALCGGLLFLVGGSVFKSSDRIRFQRDLDRHQANPDPPQTAGANALMALGTVLAVAGAVILAFSLRDMTRQIADAQSRAEASMRIEVSVKRDSKAKS